MTSPGRLAWSLWGLVVALAGTAAALRVDQGDVVEVLFVPAAGVFATVGALLAGRRPRNPIGWLLVAAALAFALDGVVTAYAESGDGPGSIPAGELALWLSEWLLFVWLGSIGIFVPLLFPDGRLPSPRWRPLAWAGGALIVVAIVGTAFGSARFEPNVGGPVDNPLAAPGALRDALELAATIGGVAFAVAVLAALCAVVGRLRRARGVERQQVKWFASAMALMLTGLTAAGVSAAFGEPGALLYVGNVGWGMFLLGLLVALPLAIAVAILRYRLYDIDLVINRALVYGAVTATLGAAYLGLVLLLGLALSPVTEGSGLAIAASTLAVAALFRPLRRRIQGLVDRRFYRHKYDAGRTLERFGARLRAETDLEALRGELTGVVRETMQPAHVSLWLREGAR